MSQPEKSPKWNAVHVATWTAFAFAMGAVALCQINLEFVLATSPTNDSSWLTTMVLWILGSGTAAVAFWQLAQRIPLWWDRSCPNPQAMFRDLCHLHGLHDRQAQELLKIAKAQSLSDPCRLFLESRLWPAESHALRTHILGSDAIC